MHAAIFGYPQKIMNLEDQAYYAGNTSGVVYCCLPR